MNVRQNKLFDNAINDKLLSFQVAMQQCDT